MSDLTLAQQAAAALLIILMLVLAGGLGYLLSLVLGRALR